MGIATGIDLEAMIEAAADAEQIVGLELPLAGPPGGRGTRTIPA